MLPYRRLKSKDRFVISFYEAYLEAEANFFKCVNLPATSIHTQPTIATMPHTALTSEDMREMRLLLVSGVQYLVTTCKEAARQYGEWHGFRDVSMGVSTSILNSSNCENLDINDLAHFVKFTEKLSDDMENAKPMVVMFGVILTKSNGKPPYTCRSWLDFKPRFESGEERSDPQNIPRINFDLMNAVGRACKEVTDADFTKMEMLND